MKALTHLSPKRIGKLMVFTVWQLIFNLLPLSPLRAFWLKLFGAQIGRNVIIDAIDFINLDRRGIAGLTIGDDCFLGRGVMLDTADSLTLQNQVTLAVRSTILTHTNVGYSDHPLQAHYPSHNKPTRINAGAFVGANATILAGITIGKQSVVAAGAVVTQNIPPHSLAAGVPAQIKNTHN